MKKYLLCLAASSIFCNAVFAQNPTLPVGFAQTVMASGLNPTSMVFDHHGNLFLAQKDGRILLLHSDGVLLPDPVLSIAVDAFNERGLAGIALHPDFDSQPWLYAYYTVPDSNVNRVSRFLLNGNLAVPGSEQILFTFDKLSSGIHNGGSMVFGKDGKLYIGTGDGGKSSNGQSLAVTLGKILRLNPDGSIPDNNPFYTELTGKNRAIYAYGLRNPFSMTLQPGSGMLYVSEVGQGAFEEVNEIQAHKNYGWSNIEGPVTNQALPPDYQNPFYAYPHTEGCAIVGAAVYEPDVLSFPAAYTGKYFFADYCRGVVKLLDLSSGLATDTFATGLKQPVAFAVNPHDGTLWYLMRSGIGGGSEVDNTSSSNGTLWKVFYTGSGAPFVSVPPQDVLLPQGEQAHFNVQVLGTHPLHFQWQKNGADMPGSDASGLDYPAVSLADNGAQFRCIVANTEGADTSAAAILTVTSNHRPLPKILAPLAGSTYKAGDVVLFEGNASDQEDGALPAGSLRWRVDFHHDSHIHPVLASVQGIATGSFTVPLAGETSTNTWYRIYLTATDQGGLEQTVWQDIFPALTDITIAGPAGIQVNVDGVLRPMPYTFQSLKRQQHIAQALDKLSAQDDVYIFQKWSEKPDSSSLFAFAAPDTAGLILHTEYSAHPLGQGTGLMGAYYTDPDYDLSGLPTVQRIDSLVNFDWGNASPFPSIMPANGFTVRWSGMVQPVFSEEYTFTVRSDDGCRLWIGDSLIIDKWVGQSTTEHTGKIRLVGAAPIPIRLEYLEMGGGANVSLRWGSAHTLTALIPKRQLYPAAPIQPAKVQGKVWHDLNFNNQLDAGEPLLDQTVVLLYATNTGELLATDVTDALGGYSFNNLLPSQYFLRFVLPVEDLGLQPFFNLDAAAQTSSLSLASQQTLNWQVSFVTPQGRLDGVVWFDANADHFLDAGDMGLEDAKVLLFTADSNLVAFETTGLNGNFDFGPLESGTYFLRVQTNALSQALEPSFGLNADGQTAMFAMVEQQNRTLDLGIQSKILDAVDPGEAAELVLQPNPVHETLSLRWGHAPGALRSVQLNDATGKIWRSFITPENTADTLQLDVQQLPSGVYFLQLVFESKRVVRRFVKI